MLDDSSDAGDRRPELSEVIAALEKQLRELEVAGEDEGAIAGLRRELGVLRKLPSEARVFLRGSGQDSTIIGYRLPPDRPAANDPEGAA